MNSLRLYVDTGALLQCPFRWDPLTCLDILAAISIGIAPLLCVIFVAQSCDAPLDSVLCAAYIAWLDTISDSHLPAS